MANVYIEAHSAEFDSAIDHLKKELKNIRTGRATTGLVEDIEVEAYESHQPLKQLANLSVPENNAISISPWDKSIVKNIEKALIDANLGLQIVNVGETILAKIPLMTEENRKEIVKKLGGKIEDARIRVRKIRDEVKEEIITAEKNKEVTEDDKYQYLAELDNYVQDLNKEIDEMRKAKEDEVMRV